MCLAWVSAKVCSSFLLILSHSLDLDPILSHANQPTIWLGALFPHPWHSMSVPKSQWSTRLKKQAHRLRLTWGQPPNSIEISWDSSPNRPGWRWGYTRSRAARVNDAGLLNSLIFSFLNCRSDFAVLAQAYCASKKKIHLASKWILLSRIFAETKIHFPPKMLKAAKGYGHCL